MTGHSRAAIARPSRGKSRSSFSCFASSGRLFAGIAALAGIIVLYGFLLSGDFLITSVVVEGARLGDPAEIVAVAGTIDEPIFSVDAAAAAERVAALPYVQRASVSTDYPSEVTITVVERVPVAVWHSGGRSLLVDRQGHVLAEGVDDGLPDVVDDVEQLVVGGKLEVEDVAAVIAIRETFAYQPIELTRTRLQGWVVTFDDRTIVLGDNDDLPKKLAVWREVALLGLPWELLDLREPDRPYYK